MFYYLQHTLLIVFFFCINSKICFSQTSGSKPNIIVILADDLGYGDVGFNRDGSFPEDRGIIPTPNLDALAQNGIILKNAHVAHPFCGPSRVAIMTGMMPHRIGAQYNLPNDITGTLGPPIEETYFPKLLQDAGYNTAAIGKWHLGFVENLYQPQDRGFDYFFGFLGGGKQYFEYDYEDSWYSNPSQTNEYRNPLRRNRNYISRNEFSNNGDEDYLTDVLTDDAIAYINSNAPSADPFFMYLSYNAPHTPLQAPAAEIAQFKQDNPNFESLVLNSDYINNSNPVTKGTSTPQELTEKRIVYATMVANMDANIGRVVNALQNNGELDSTLIIFLSDNGGYTFSKGAVNYPLDALKGSVKEGGHKVPMFIHWPDQITSGSTYNHQISSLDLYPTLVDLAGGTIPDGKTLDGVSFMDNVLAGANARPNDPLIIMRPQNGFHNGGLSKNQWKIVKTGGNGSWKLYNILNDPGESIDLRSTEPNAETIIEELMDKAAAMIEPFKGVKPEWYDNDGDGSGHPHSFLWNDGTLPAYNRLFERNSLLTDNQFQISIEGTTNAIEGETSGVFTIYLPDGVTAPEDIHLSYTSSGSAIEGQDFTALSGSITISSGQNSATIQIVATEDNIDEGSETLQVQLDTTSYGSISTSTASIQIEDSNTISLTGSQSFTFDTSVQNYSGYTSGTSITHIPLIEGKQVVQWNHANKGQPSFKSDNIINADTNTYLKVVFQNNSNATHFRLKHNSDPASWVQVSITANSTAWQTVILDLSNLNSNFSGTKTHSLIYQFREGSTPLTGNIFVDEMTFEDTATLSIQEYRTRPSVFTLYPNPVKNKLFIEGETTIDAIEIYNLKGKKIASYFYQSSVQVQTLNKGIYLVGIHHDKNITFKKFIKH